MVHDFVNDQAVLGPADRAIEINGDAPGCVGDAFAFPVESLEDKLVGRTGQRQQHRPIGYATPREGIVDSIDGNLSRRNRRES